MKLEVLKHVLILATVSLVLYVLSPLVVPISHLLDRLAPPAKAEFISNRAIISSLRGIGKLVTVTSDPHSREIFLSVSEGILNSGYYGANHEVDGIIEAGIDFTKITSSSLRCDEFCILLLPSPGITNCTITRLRQKEQTIAIGKDWELLEELVRYEAILMFVEDVQEIGIVEKAREETEFLMGEFVSNLTGKLVDVRFEPGGQGSPLSPTCLPDPPFGWEKDPDGAWRRQ